MIRYSANLSMLFAEVPFLERFQRAADAGFRFVEFAWPGEDLVDPTIEAARSAEVQVVLMNFDGGDMLAGDRGLAGDPVRNGQFRRNVPVAVKMAEGLGCRRLNALVGRRSPSISLHGQLELAADSIAFAADAAATVGADVLVENLNPIDGGEDILIQRVDQALELIGQADRPNLALQVDLFHAQRAEGNLTETLARVIRQVGHIQIADVPGRGEPGTGEVNFQFIFAELERLGYEGFVGLEYKATTPSTEGSLGWLRELG